MSMLRVEQVSVAICHSSIYPTVARVKHRKLFSTLPHGSKCLPILDSSKGLHLNKQELSTGCSTPCPTIASFFVEFSTYPICYCPKLGNPCYRGAKCWTTCDIWPPTFLPFAWLKAQDIVVSTFARHHFYQQHVRTDTQLAFHYTAFMLRIL